MRARGVIPHLERRPEAAAPGEIPLMRSWTDEQWQDFNRRLEADMRADPRYYGRAAVEQMGLEWQPPEVSGSVLG